MASFGELAAVEDGACGIEAALGGARRGARAACDREEQPQREHHEPYASTSVSDHGSTSHRRVRGASAVGADGGAYATRGRSAVQVPYAVFRGTPSARPGEDRHSTTPVLPPLDARTRNVNSCPRPLAAKSCGRARRPARRTARTRSPNSFTDLEALDLRARAHGPGPEPAAGDLDRLAQPHRDGGRRDGGAGGRWRSPPCAPAMCPFRHRAVGQALCWMRPTIGPHGTAAPRVGYWADRSRRRP